MNIHNWMGTCLALSVVLFGVGCATPSEKQQILDNTDIEQRLSNLENRVSSLEAGQSKGRATQDDLRACLEQANVQYEKDKSDTCRLINIRDGNNPNSPCPYLPPASDRRIEADQKNRIDTCKTMYQ